MNSSVVLCLITRFQKFYYHEDVFYHYTIERYLTLMSIGSDTRIAFSFLLPPNKTHVHLYTYDVFSSQNKVGTYGYINHIRIDAVYKFTQNMFVSQQSNHTYIPCT